MIISFLGPDGSGKSTIIEKIKQTNLFSEYYYFHLKPLTDKNLDCNVDIVTDPHAKPIYSKSKSFVKLIYLTIQYNWGWLKNILRLNNKTTLIIFDRYFDDLIVDHKRYRYGGSIVFARFIRLFIPKPEIYFILTAGAEILFERKREVSLDELKRQLKEYKKLVDNKRYFEIDVNRTLDDIIKDIIKLIKINKDSKKN